MSEQNIINSNYILIKNPFLSKQNINDNHSIGLNNNLINQENNNTSPESSIREKNKKSKPKYREVCLRRKLKGLVLKYAFKFIKEKIKDKNDVIKKIGYAQINNVKIEFEKEFIYKTLGDIFCDPISTKHTTIKEKENYNKNKIDKLKESDFNLKNIFAVTFILCLNHFMGIENIKVLEGMKTFEEIKTLEKLDKMEESNLKFISSNYENKILHSIPRNIE